jgi:hypothetical protein
MLFALLMFAANLAAVITVDLEDWWRERRRRSVYRVAGPPWWHRLALVRLLKVVPSSHPSIVVKPQPVKRQPPDLLIPLPPPSGAPRPYRYLQISEGPVGPPDSD